MTKQELYNIEDRTKEIEEIIKLCGPNDDDVLYNLEKECSSYIEKLEKEIKRMEKIIYDKFNS